VTLEVAKPDETLVVGAGRERKLSAGSDVPYRVWTGAITAVVAAVIVLFFYAIISKSIPGWRTAGLHFFTGTDWNFGAGKFGALPLIVGTLLTTGLALLLAAPTGVAAAVAIAFLIPKRLRLVVSTLVEILAFVPSVVYGVWGYLLIAPWLDHTVQPWLVTTFHHTWPFNGPNGIGFGLMLGSMVLAIMILPTVAAISRDVLVAVPDELVEGGLSVGASKGQVLRRVVLPSAKSGIFGAIVLGTGRALGETVALYLLLGSLDLRHPFPRGLLSGTATLATELVQNFGNGANNFGVLACLAVTLMVIVFLVNLSARLIVRRSLKKLTA
jgi:phosphate transport system permease protein